MVPNRVDLAPVGVENDVGLVPDAQPYRCRSTPTVYWACQGNAPFRLSLNMTNSHPAGSSQSCSCSACEEVLREHARARGRREACGTSTPLVPVSEVRAHLKWLSKCGIGWEQVAEAAGIGRTTVADIAYPSGSRRGVTVRVADAVFAVAPTLDNSAPGAHVPSAGTARRLQALMLQGWDLRTIQEFLGVSALGRVLTRDTVTVRVALLVRSFYDTHWHRRPVADSPTKRTVVARTVLRAQAEGFLPALAWDEDAIDDPCAEPDRTRVRSNPSAQVHIYLEDLEFLANHGASWNEVERRLGACRNSLETVCRRATRTDVLSKITSNRWVAA